MKIELLDLKRSYNGKTILHIDRLELENGKIYAILGPNGSGKTTLLRILAGIDRGCSGQMCYNGTEKMPEDDIAYMPQSNYLFDMTVLHNVQLAMKKVRNSRSNTEELAMTALQQVGMASFKDAKARSLSGGEAQKVALARTLVLGKNFVLLDEPASATDIRGMELVEKYIQSTQKKDGSTLVFTTHNPSQAARIASEVIFMHCGRIIEKGCPASVFNSPQSSEVSDFLTNWRI